MDGSLFERGKALEDRFFGQRDQELLEKLKAELANKGGREALAAASGVSDEAVLDAMLNNEITAETLTSISLVPLVAVAWADGVMEAEEKAAILKAAAAAGIGADSAAYGLLSNWLGEKPGEELVASWKEYVGSLKTTVDATSFGQLKNTVMGRAKDVAAAAGGFLGIGSVSSAETAVIEDLESAFE